MRSTSSLPAGPADGQQDANGRIDPTKAVKKYQRAAGQTVLPSDVRPPRVLQLTLDYLFRVILSSAPLLSVWGFLWDRMRSIRQDCTFQSARGAEAIDLHERIARAHALAIHELRGLPTFDTKLCNDALNGSASSLLRWFRLFHDLRTALKSLTEMYAERRLRGEAPSLNEAEFYAYYLIFAYSPGTLHETSQLPPYLLADPLLQLAFRLCALSEHNNRAPSRAHGGRNAELSLNGFSRLFKLIASSKTPYLLACVIEDRFSDVRLGALKTLKKAYHTPVSLPLVELAKMLGCDDDEHCSLVCRDFGVKMVEEDGVAVAALLHAKDGTVLNGACASPLYPRCRCDNVQST